MNVQEAMNKAKRENKGMTCFGVLGDSERHDVETQLDGLGVSYETSTMRGEYDMTPYDIYADVNTYK